MSTKDQTPEIQADKNPSLTNLQQWQSIHGLNSYPPGYNPGPAPAAPREQNFQQQKQDQINLILREQQAVRNENTQQKQYDAKLNNPNESAYKIANLETQPVRIEPQHTATSQDQALADYNDLVSKTKTDYNDFVSKTKTDQISFDSNVPDKPTGNDSLTIKLVKDKPTQEVSQHTLDLINRDRSAAGLGSINDEENIKIIPAKVNPPDYSDGTKKFNENQIQILGKLQEAKAAGITKLDLYNSSGVKVGETNPQDITRARFDILKTAIAQKDSITFKWTQTQNEVTSTKTEYVRSNDNLLKVAGASAVGVLGTIGLDIGLGISERIADITGKEIFGIKPGTTPEQVQNKVSEMVEKSVGVTPSEKILSGDFSDIAKSSLGETAVSIAVAGAAMYVSGGGKGEELKSVVTKLLNPKSTEKAIEFLNEGKISNLEKPGQKNIDTGKVNQVYTYSQGTEEKIGISTLKYDKAPPQVERLESGKVQNQSPSFPSNVKETIDITGIGPKGEKVTITKPNTEVNIEPQKKGSGPPQVPESIINPKGSTLLIRSQPQDVLAVNAVLLKTYSNLSQKEIDFLGVKPQPGMKNVYYSELTPDLAMKLNYFIEKENLVSGTDIFKVSSEDFKKNAYLLSSGARNPKIFQHFLNEAGEQRISLEKKEPYKNPNTKANLPFVIRYFEGINKSGLDTLLPKEDLGNKGPELKQRSLSSGPFGLGPNLQIGKFSEDAAKNAINLLKNSEQSPKTFGVFAIKTESPTEYSSINLNLKTSTNKNQRSSNTQEELVYERLAYPPGNKGKVSDRLNFDMENLQNTKGGISLGLKDLNVTDSRTKLAEQSKTDQSFKVDLGLGTVGKTESVTKQTTGSKFDITQRQEQVTKQDQLTIPKIITEKPPPSKKIEIFGDIELPDELRRKEKPVKKGKWRSFYYSWNVNQSNPGAYLPGKELRVSKSKKIFKQTEKLEIKVNRGPRPKRKRANKEEKQNKQTFGKLDKSLVKKSFIKKGKWKIK